jgi:hypothetical protein
MGEEAALAHVELFCKGTDSEPLEALDGGDIHGACEDGFARAEATGLAAGSSFFAGGARSTGHGHSVTQGK